jgi:hypothetical protein
VVVFRSLFTRKKYPSTTIGNRGKKGYFSWLMSLQPRFAYHGLSNATDLSATFFDNHGRYEPLTTKIYSMVDGFTEPPNC